MKLKYYLLGLGVGIVLTTLILTISNRPKTLSDQEIINRALRLGMVMDKKKDSDIDTLLENIKNPTNSNSDNTEEKEKDYNDTDIEENSGNITPTVEPSKIDTTPTLSPIPENEVSTNDDVIPEATTETVRVVDNEDQEEVTFKITRGMTATDVAELLYNLDLIDNPTMFNQYIKTHNNTSNIIVNKYTIKKGSSYEEIMNTIISKKL